MQLSNSSPGVGKDVVGGAQRRPEKIKNLALLTFQTQISFSFLYWCLKYVWKSQTYLDGSSSRCGLCL